MKTAELSPAEYRAWVDARIAATGRLGELQEEAEAIAREALESAGELNDAAQAAINLIDDEIAGLCLD